ncbi:hypothetical protein UB23_26070 [Pseudomonas sp. ES3-33]|nr:hypothetical protein UB23_26070 [Pseudomonas sp. ES3-33]
MRGGTLLALIQEKPTSIAGHGAKGEQGRTGRVISHGANTVGAAAGCDLLILIFSGIVEDRNQKIAARSSFCSARVGATRTG